MSKCKIRLHSILSKLPIKLHVVLGEWIWDIERMKDFITNSKIAAFDNNDEGLAEKF